MITNHHVLGLRADAYGPTLDPQDRPADHAAEVRRLVAAAARGDQAAWEALVRQFGAIVRSVARAHRLSDADASDVAQASWLRLFENLPRLREPALVGPWLATTARRECLRVLREKQRHVPVGDEIPEHEVLDSSPAETVLAAERDAALRRSLARLQASDQALLRLLVAEPRPSYEEIGAALDMPIGSIGPTRQRALERLRRELANQGALQLVAA